MTRPTRRAVLGGMGAFAVLPRPLLAENFAPSAVSLARPVPGLPDATPLQIEDGTGAPVSLADYAGRIVVLNLWGPWCVPCRREMPSLARLAEVLEGHAVDVMPLAFDWRGASGVRRFYTETGIDNLPVLIGEGENLKAVLDLENLPSTAILDTEGRMRFVVAGEARWDDDKTVDWLRAML